MNVHIKEHLTPLQRDVLDVVVLPITITEASQRMPDGWSRRSVEGHYHRILQRLHVKGSGHGAVGLRRVALVRLYYGLDPCYCQRYVETAPESEGRQAFPRTVVREV